MKQWLEKERYDGYGNYNPSKFINNKPMNNNYVVPTLTEIFRGLTQWKMTQREIDTTTDEPINTTTLYPS